MERDEYQNEVNEQNAEKRRMKSVASFMPALRVQKKRGGINSTFNDAVGRAIECMGDKEHTFGYWCGRLRGIPPQVISEWISKCKGATSPLKLFQWLLKEYRKTLSTSNPTPRLDNKKARK